MSSTAQSAYEAFQHVIERAGDFNARPGQQKMARLVAKTMADGALGRDAKDPDRAIAVIQAGTGVGKSLAAAVPAIQAALERQTRVIISTATINLQEQLVNKDLPRFAQLMDRPFKYALGKGRGRYVCKLKLNRLAAGADDPHADLFGDAMDEEPRAAKAQPGVNEASIVLYRELAKDLDQGKWNGERDALDISERDFAWGAVAADRASCTGRNCPQRGDCVYFAARKSLADADVIVVNHDLLLASLDANVLPPLEESLLILDEAHELGAVASSQFKATIDLSSLRWLDEMGKRISKVGGAIVYEATTDAVNLTGQIKQAMSDLQALVMSMYGSYVNSKEKTVRLPQGEVPEPLQEPLRFLLTTSKALGKHLTAMADSIRDKLQAGPDPTLATMYTALGTLAPRLDDVAACADMFMSHQDKPDSKWFAFSDDAGFVRVTANACPIIPGDLLVHDFWPRVRSAVLTSATLTSCGTFDFFLREVGLDNDPAVTTLQVESPFDYPTQGRLVVVKTSVAPKQIQDYNREVAGEMLADFLTVERGALALFTSRAHLDMTYEAMPEGLRERVLIQGSMSRANLVREHRRRVDAGQPAIIMGLQSFGQGVDLPGAYCETVFVAKLPFTPPTDPVGEARAEWLSGQGRDAFAELSVPATGVKLAQWVGRLIRTEQDRGTVMCYDKRILETAYGKRILKGLPAFAVTVRHHGIEAPVRS